MIHQLRIYEIFDANKAAFHARFRDHAGRIMRKYDFRILAMWENINTLSDTVEGGAMFELPITGARARQLRL